MKSAKSRIDDLLEQSAKTTAIIANASGTAPKGIKKSKRFQIALIAAGYPDFANQIASCNTKSSCGSTYCTRCRALLSHRLKTRTEKTVLSQFFGNDKIIHDEVRHVSGLVSIEQIDKSQIAYSIREARKIFAEASRNRPWFKVAGAFELELLDFRHMDTMTDEKSAVKRDQLKALLKDTLTRHILGDDEMVVLVHWHALMSGLEYKSDPTGKTNTKLVRSALDVVTQAYARHHRQLYVQRLYDPAKRSTKESLVRICSYPFKDAYRLKYTFDGSSYDNGEWVDDKTLGRFIKVYREVGGHANRGLAI